MNDRFKFRFWNKGNKKIETYSNDDLGFLLSNPKAQLRYVVMQSTGLKDKNGKLIYEGDIVEREHIQGKKRGVVEFNENLLEFRATNMSLFSLVNRSVVIGNIYENEDLLK